MLLTGKKGEEKKIIQAGRQKNHDSFEVILFLVLIEIIIDSQIQVNV